jgi:chromate reductase, NAD(P)H dehydrogenase (quinone)
MNIAAFSGSLRKNSYNTKLVKAFAHLAPPGVIVEIVPIGDLPLINQDLETDLPPTVKLLHRRIDASNAILLATPEYNRSYSPVLKNALDWGSRPEGKNKWDKKPALVIGATPYSLGAFGAQHHLRQVLVYLNMYPLQQPEFYLANAEEKFNDQGRLTDEKTRTLISKVWISFIEWVRKVES